MTKTYLVYDGTYPFKNVIGDVVVGHQDIPEEEAALALAEAIYQYGGHPVVEPAGQHS